jgi:hypothetical protein
MALKTWENATTSPERAIVRTTLKVSTAKSANPTITGTPGAASSATTSAKPEACWTILGVKASAPCKRTPLPGAVFQPESACGSSNPRWSSDLQLSSCRYAPPRPKSRPLISLPQINSSQLNVTCGENAVYVYDGLPELVDMGSQSALSAVFCTEEALPVSTVESRTGQLTVHYKQGLSGEGFSAMYKVLDCDDDCQPPRECIRGQCVCQEGLVGFNCEEVICPRNCSFARQQGLCDKAYGRCICAGGWVGPSCDIRYVLVVKKFIYNVLGHRFSMLFQKVYQSVNTVPLV